MSRRTPLALLYLSLAVPAAAQFDEGAVESRYDVQYGKPVDVTLSDLGMNPEMYESRAVRTHGRLERSFDNRDLYYLRDLNAAVTLVPVQDIRVHFDEDARTWMGQVIEITAMGIDADTVRPARRPTYTVTIPKMIPKNIPNSTARTVNSGTFALSGT